MSEKPILVVLSPRFPYPLEKGDKLRLFNQLKALVTEFQVHLISLSDSKVSDHDKAVLEKIVYSSHILYQSRFRLLKAIAYFTFGRKALQINYYKEAQLEQKIIQLINDISPDIVYVQLVRAAHMVKDFEGKKAIDYMDAMSLNMEREATFQTIFKKNIYKIEAKRILQSEKEYSSLFDKKFIISDPDKSYLENKGITNIEVLNNGVDTNYFQPKIKSEPCKYDIAFVGNMGYLPNVLAAEYLVNEIVKKADNKYKVLIAGARPHKRVLKLASKHVEITGWVEDIRASYLNAKVIVAPIFSGAGQQNKILEAMSLRKVCITSTQVNKAIGAEDGKEIFIADSSDAYLKIISELINNPQLTTEIGKNARNFVLTNFSWESAGNFLNKELLKLLK